MSSDVPNKPKSWIVGKNTQNVKYTFRFPGAVGPSFSFPPSKFQLLSVISLY